MMRKKRSPALSTPEATAAAVFVGVFPFLFTIKNGSEVSYLDEVKAQGRGCTSKAEHLPRTPQTLAQSSSPSKKQTNIVEVKTNNFIIFLKNCIILQVFPRVIMKSS